MVKRMVVLAVAGLMFSFCQPLKTTKNCFQVKSPDGKLKVNFIISENGKPSYDVTLQRGNEVIQVVESSPLGVVRNDQRFDTALQVTRCDSVRVIRENYSLIAGKRTKNAATANELVVTLANASTEPLQVIFRAYNDGVAFRYVFPEANDSVFVVESERTGFKPPATAKAWMEPYDTVSKWTPGYERFFLNEIPVTTASPTNEGWCFPALFEVNNAWMLITESDLSDNYAASHLKNAAGSSEFTIEKPNPREAEGLGSNNSESSLPWSMPWRVLIIGDKLSTIVESNLVQTISRAPQGDFSWVKPGRASWSWWSDQNSPQDFQSLKRYVDFSKDMGWEYSLVDANWNKMKGGSLRDLATYATSRNVGLWVWHNSGGPHNIVEEQPRDIMNDDARRKHEMQQLSSWGIKGIKVDFFQSDKQFLIKEYLDILRDAADNHLMVNFHGCTVPRGWSRTWPNLLSMESVRGAECYLFAKEFPDAAPQHNVTLPFTRNVIGPMDYTVATLSNTKLPHRTTFAHELALPVIFESGIIHYADKKESYESLPSAAKQILRSMPSAWDDIKLLDGRPGRDVAIARRAGTTWYIGCANGEQRSKEIKLDFSFLESGDFVATVIEDGNNPGDLKVASVDVTSTTIKTIPLRGYGGSIVELKRKK